MSLKENSTRKAHDPLPDEPLHQNNPLVQNRSVNSKYVQACQLGHIIFRSTFSVIELLVALLTFLLKVYTVFLRRMLVTTPSTPQILDYLKEIYILLNLMERQ